MTQYLYMDYVDFLYELGATGGTTCFASIEELKDFRLCVKECGIVKVKIEQVKVVDEGTYKNVKAESEEQKLEKRIKHVKNVIKKMKEITEWHEKRLLEGSPT